jgi:NAD+ kinase
MADLRVLILSSFDRTDVAVEIERLRALVEEYGEVVLVDVDNRCDLSEVEADFAVVVGGDGSILRAAHQMGYRQIPVIGVNMGRLGFLSDALPEQMPAVLSDVAAGRFRIVGHLMFESTVLRGQEVVCEHLGLNEVAVLAGPPFALVTVDLYVDSELATTYSCDGLIVSTPVGSTAHNLSAGGPIVRKNLQAFVICPISPHTLTNRPVVDSADHLYEMVVPQPHEGTSVVVDGQVACVLQANDRVQIRRADASFQLVQTQGRGYYKTLRDKLGWSGGFNSRGS